MSPDCVQSFFTVAVVESTSTSVIAQATDDNQSSPFTAAAAVPLSQMPFDPSAASPLDHDNIAGELSVLDVHNYIHIRYPSIRQHLTCVDCLEDKREDYRSCSVLHCIT